jgi:hypothetical protein
MRIPYPPCDCKVAYIQDGELLTVPTGAFLPGLCVKCGDPTDLKIRKTYHWPPFQPSFSSFLGRWLAISIIIFALRRLFRLDARVKMEVPLRRSHRARQFLRRRIGIVFTVAGLVLVPLSVKAINVRSPLEAVEWAGTLALVMTGVILIAMGVELLDLVELNDSFAAYKGFGLGFMEKVPCEREVFFPPKASAG